MGKKNQQQNNPITKKNREVVCIAKQTQYSLDKDCTFKESHRKKDMDRKKETKKGDLKRKPVDTFQSQTWPNENQTVGC